MYTYIYVYKCLYVCTYGACIGRCKRVRMHIDAEMYKCMYIAGRRKAGRALDHQPVFCRTRIFWSRQKFCFRYFVWAVWDAIWDVVWGAVWGAVWGSVWHPDSSTERVHVLICRCTRNSICIYVCKCICCLLYTSDAADD